MSESESIRALHRRAIEMIYQTAKAREESAIAQGTVDECRVVILNRTTDIASVLDDLERLGGDASTLLDGSPQSVQSELRCLAASSRKLRDVLGLGEEL
jgi:hypothetical protein